MNSKPILFQGAMVRALLDGSKTQTRRICKPAQAANLSAVTGIEDPREIGQRPLEVPGSGWFGDEDGELQFQSPYGKPGDRLWVRETWGNIDPDCTGEDPEERNDEGQRGGPCKVYHADMMKEGSSLREFWRRRVAFAATWEDPKFGKGPDAPKRWRPSIHMPRWASRITLEITAVRVERLNDISEEDSIAEGIEARGKGWLHYGSSNAGELMRWAKSSYRSLWEMINGPGSWDANPWVWVVEFKRVPPAGDIETRLAAVEKFVELAKENIHTHGPNGRSLPV